MGSSTPLRKRAAFAAAFAVMVTLCVPIAQAHRLSLLKAHAASVDTAEFVCNQMAGCTDYQVEPCRRLSAHKVRCKRASLAHRPDDRRSGHLHVGRPMVDHSRLEESALVAEGVRSDVQLRLTARRVTRSRPTAGAGWVRPPST
jgi:hypothetical protein